MRYEAVLFDMDGVLIQSEQLMRSCAIHALADYGVHARHEDFMEFTGMGEDRFVGGVAEKYGLPYRTEMKNLAYDYYDRRVAREASIPAGVGQMLHTLHDRGLVLAVCSAADLRKVRYNLRAIGVEESLFAALVTGSDVQRKKPFPDIYLEGARRVCTAPERCLVVEDAISGIQAAHAAGMDAVAVTTTFNAEQLRRQAQPDYILERIDLLSDLLKP